MFRLIRKDSGEGVVYASGKGRVLVASLAGDSGAAAPKSSCGGKAGCGHCGGCAPLPDAYTGRFHVSVPNSDSFKAGDRVAFNRYVPEPNVVSALVFGIPLVLIMAVIFLWLRYAPERAESLPALLTIGAAFVTGIIILAILDTLFKKWYPPVITATEQPR
ncbi:MAG: SoxR reducing system RseC family protein [Chitinispirillia bacterium]|nr:SoxR reducing system RseC family protein [Chitinispirillia bacterium]MCL2242476.1 SoxR reducing system RseC family protein [Chitinispirillia bacterium]